MRKKRQAQGLNGSATWFMLPHMIWVLSIFMLHFCYNVFTANFLLSGIFYTLLFFIFHLPSLFVGQKGRKREIKTVEDRKCCISAHAYVSWNCMCLFCWLNWTSWRHDKFVFTTSLLYSATAIVLLIAWMLEWHSKHYTLHTTYAHANILNLFWECVILMRALKLLQHAHDTQHPNKLSQMFQYLSWSFDSKATVHTLYTKYQI